ncbi:MAG TPA: ribosome biogenesis GTPase Der, partial [Clostridiales bacterium]|nr:ribosome biogenesis GTPase Der [Clostridiales bacterium]
PNVGKSTFFNKLIGKRISIVDNTPGITRDRIMFDIDWNGVDMLLVDTGGIEPKADTVILKHILTQAQLAI